ncbi:MAG: hypothetical protein J6S67_23485 [Methanobrevibacter sp.]|nr:hypothetical protein [Methanobrevibacter sp.]
MADKKKATHNNNIRIVGYLKENNLEQVTNTRGDQVIRGSIIVATSKVSSYKIQFYVSETTSKGEKSQDYERVSALLPQNTITIASFLKDNSAADFDSAINTASRVWVMARFDEYATRSGERVNSNITLKGSRGGFANSDKTPFTPCAEFDVDIYINKLTPELDDKEKETGRLNVEGLIPKYDKSVDVVDFVAVTEDNVAKFISANWKVGDTVNVTGDLISIQERILSDAAETERFGRSSAPQYETRFIRERRITGGSKDPKRTEEEGVITKEFVKNGLAERELKMERNAAQAKKSPNTTTTETAPSSRNMDEMDF